MKDRRFAQANAVMAQREELYGCNMAFRGSAIGDVGFDEEFPFYGWQEDVDSLNRVGGKNIRIGSLMGVHCGTLSGRETNRAILGYRQIDTPLF